MLQHVQKVSEQYAFVREATPEEIERELNEVKSALGKLAGRATRTPVTEALSNYLRLLRQARAVA
jgi:hypothetical protein